jgi:hypothetical protein
MRPQTLAEVAQFTLDANLFPQLKVRNPLVKK